MQRSSTAGDTGQARVRVQVSACVRGQAAVLIGGDRDHGPTIDSQIHPAKPTPRSPRTARKKDPPVLYFSTGSAQKKATLTASPFRTGHHPRPNRSLHGIGSADAASLSVMPINHAARWLLGSWLFRSGSRPVRCRRNGDRSSSPLPPASHSPRKGRG